MLAQGQSSNGARPQPSFGSYVLPDSSQLGPKRPPWTQGYHFCQQNPARMASSAGVATPFSANDTCSNTGWQPYYHKQEKAVFIGPLHQNEYHSSSLLPLAASDYHKQQQQQHVSEEGGIGGTFHQFFQQSHNKLVEPAALSDAMATACGPSLTSSSFTLSLMPGASTVSSVPPCVQGSSHQSSGFVSGNSPVFNLGPQSRIGVERSAVRKVEDTECPVLPQLQARSRSQRRPRKLFSKAQLDKLKQRFHHQCYLSAPEREQLAAVTKLTPKQVRVWFENKRYSKKRGDQLLGAHWGRPAVLNAEKADPKDPGMLSPASELSVGSAAAKASGIGTSGTRDHNGRLFSPLVTFQPFIQQPSADNYCSQPTTSESAFANEVAEWTSIASAAPPSAATASVIHCETKAPGLW